MYLFYNFYLEFFLIFLILCSLSQLIFFKIFKIKVTAEPINNRLDVYKEGYDKELKNFMATFDFGFDGGRLFLNNAALILQKFYSGIFVGLLTVNCFVIVLDLVGSLNCVKTQMFYINFFDNNFILDHSWCDRFYLCVTSLLLFLGLFIVRLTEYNFK
jgi:hypothetical protein